MRVADALIDAVRFWTIVPVPPSSRPMPPDWLARSFKYAPMIGAGIGLVAGSLFVLAGTIWTPAVAAILACATSIVITGGMHEDGLADTADGLGGGRTPERRLAIMKDSRIGTFGALALGIGIALRVAALAALPGWGGLLALIAAHAAARAAPALVMQRMSYAGDVAAKKVPYAASRLSGAEMRLMLIAVALAVLPLALVSLAAIAAGLLIGAALAWALALWSRRTIGGYTGDVLGAIEQVVEIGVLLGVAAIIR